MTKISIYLDDIRTPTIEGWKVVRNYDEFVSTVMHHGLENIEVISLDHDLGDQAMVEYYTNVNRAVFPGIQGGPLMHVIGAKGVAFNEACTSEYKEYIKQVKNNVTAFIDELRKSNVVCSSSDNHLFLIDA